MLSAESLEKRILDVISVPIELWREHQRRYFDWGYRLYSCIDSVEALLKKTDQAFDEVKRGK